MTCATVSFAEEMPYSIQELLGPRSISTIYGKSHAQMRKVLNSFFTPKAMAAYTCRLAELATEICSEMAAAGQTKGEDGMKKFAFKVLPSRCHKTAAAAAAGIATCSAMP